jgi:hypothetical protein
VLIVHRADRMLTIHDGRSARQLVAVHGLDIGPQFSPDARFVYFASRDGWITQYDLSALRIAAEIRAGNSLSHLAISGDGKWLLAASAVPGSLVLLDAGTLVLRREYAVQDERGASSRVAAVRTAWLRNSFVVALRDLPQLWEISWDPNAEPVYRGYVHDYRMGEGIAETGQFTPRVIDIDEPFVDFALDAPCLRVTGYTRAGRGSVIDLRVRRKVADAAVRQTDAKDFVAADGERYPLRNAGEGRCAGGQLNQSADAGVPRT